VTGAYGLEFVVEQPFALRAGRLGMVVLPAGRLRYLGSAYGPGGLGARVRRHLDPTRRRDRWHVDALTRAVPVTRILVVPGGQECELVAAHLEDGRWSAPVPGFGSSDCRRCPSHLLHSDA
jgi:Uri superfamily endonuclease